jgi:hypothetical protein
MSTASVPRGPGLFEVVRGRGEPLITNIRRLAGAERAPGSRLVSAATVLLALLAAGLFVVSLSAQYRYVFAVKHQSVPAAIEAIGLDVGMAIFSLLALGLAMAGQSARIERILIVVCALGSAGQNYAAADVTSPRSVAAYVVPPVFLAVVVDRVIAVVRRHVLGDCERSAWSGLGKAALYGLRFILAAPSTSSGLRRLVLELTPLPELEPARVLAIEPLKDEAPPNRCPVKIGNEPGALCGKPLPCPDHLPVNLTEPPELAEGSKKDRLLWWYRQHPAYGDRGQSAAMATLIAAKIGLSPGTARAYVSQHLTSLDEEAKAS